ncbi:ankyrin repeat and SOCS box protein 13-like isoform X2 [Gigantopelta aegis]|nr:ankyrin repeat and SOCS box protein 13-like isoform X2 [Gigantopelta aegis]
MLLALIQRCRDRVNSATTDLVRPLHEASLFGHLDCVKALLKAGAEVNVRNIDGATPLCDACCCGNTDIVQILLSYGAVVNPPLLLATPLHEAVLRDNWKCTELLVDAGAKLDSSDCHFGTPLHICAMKGYTMSAEILLAAGAKVNVIHMHNAPLHEAARSQYMEVLLLLLNYGANVYARNSHSKTASDLVPSSTSPAKQLLQYWESNPRALCYLCRQTIRDTLGCTRLSHINHFLLPKFLKDYLLFL